MRHYVVHSEIRITTNTIEYADSEEEAIQDAKEKLIDIYNLEYPSAYGEQIPSRFEIECPLSETFLDEEE